MAACTAPPPSKPPSAPVVEVPEPIEPPTPADQALGLYGPAEEAAPAPVATTDGRETDRDFYDPANPGARHLQRADEATASFPRDRLGNVDWVRALAEGRIAPRADLHGRGDRGPMLDTPVLMTDTAEMPYVRFPHRQHTAWLDCSNCHPRPFLPEAGANPITMSAILQGEYCGVCHDRVAFSTYACERCHSVPNPAAPVPAW
ncbi:MAG: cytochrome c3 family protein [Gammaproteobacteria bacterium]|nr:cytochrome c3 family protein [Gammaproteobacteria bacterium]